MTVYGDSLYVYHLLLLRLSPPIEQLEFCHQSEYAWLNPNCPENSNQTMESTQQCNETREILIKLHQTVMQEYPPQTVKPQTTSTT